MPLALLPNQCRSSGVVADTFGAACKFGIFVVIDDFCRKNLRLVADSIIWDARVACELDAQIRFHGKPTPFEAPRTLARPDGFAPRSLAQLETGS
ncbi:MAG: hypothetical protein P3W94_009610 [Paracoccus sp. (in: a-proteobacteria)]|nr:hypothetical protein [Paracoccus sp. (in: a-proteobacteria)]